jgi:hypothetical protein
MTIPTIGAIDQVRIWLKTGTAPQRDLFWLAAPELCAETYGKGLKLYESKDLCRSSYIHFTDWVGIDRLLNQFFDFNLFVVALLTCVWTAAIAMKVMEANGPYS